MTRIVRELRGVGECISNSGLIGWYIERRMRRSV